MVSLFFQQPLAWAWSELGDLVGPGQVDRLENFQPFAVADENPPVSDIALAELERIADLRLEYKVRAALCKGIELCEQHNDYVTREILRVQLNDTEEDHTYWLEKQLGLIKLIGLENYLQSQF